MPVYGNIRLHDDIIWEVDANKQHWATSQTSGLADGTGITVSSTMPGITADIDHDTVQYIIGNYGDADVGGAYFQWDASHEGMIRLIAADATAANQWNDAKSLTGMVWFQSDGSSRQVVIARYNPDVSVYHWNQIVDPGGEMHYNSSGVISGAAGDINSDTGWDDNTWHLFCLSYNVGDGYFRWYIDGDEKVSVSVGTDSGAGVSGYSDNTTWWSIGSRSDGYESLHGKIAVARLYNRALNTAEMNELYQTERQRFHK